MTIVFMTHTLRGKERILFFSVLCFVICFFLYEGLNFFYFNGDVY